MKYVRAALASAMLVLPLLSVSAQDRNGAEPTTYKVEFNLRDGAQSGASAGRRYAMVLAAKGHGTFRIGNRVPVATQSQDAGKPALVSTQYTYVDVGVNIGCEVREVAAGQIGLRATLDISSVLPRDKPAETSAAGRPVIGQLKIDVDTLVSPGKPRVVASIDDPVTARRLDVEATVTRIE
jgi:hypothetical protein